MATKIKPTKNAKKSSGRRNSKIILEVLWRPPKSIIMVLAAGIIFALAGYTAIRLSNAQTTSPPRGSGLDNQAAALKIMPLGDSVTFGDTGLPNSYRLALWQKLVTEDGMKIDYVGSQKNGTSALPDKDNEGHAGWHIDQLNTDATKWLGDQKPDVVLVQAGASDLLDGDSTTETISRLNSLLNTISNTPKIKIFVGSLTPLSGNAEWDRQAWHDYNAVIPQLVSSFKQRGVDMTFVDFEKQGVGVGEQDMINDGIFLTNSGYEKMAAEWHDSLRMHAN